MSVIPPAPDHSFPQLFLLLSPEVVSGILALPPPPQSLARNSNGRQALFHALLKRLSHCFSFLVFSFVLPTAVI